MKQVQLHMMAEAVALKLAQQHYPAHVQYGPVVAQPANYPSGLIQIERDDTASDGLEPTQGARSNPVYRGVRRMAGRVLIYAQETREGAQLEEHQTLCEQYVDAFLVAVSEWCVETERGNDPLRVTSARYLTPTERNHEVVWPGVVYRIQFSIPRAVLKLSFEGAARPAAPFPSVVNRTDVKYPGTNETPPDANCGGDS